MDKTDFCSNGSLEALLENLARTFYEFKSHEHIENQFIMEQLRQRLKMVDATSQAVCNCHKDSRLAEVLGLLRDGTESLDLPDALRLVNVKGVAAISASIAAAQAALTSTLTPPTPQRKLKTISAAAAAGGNNNSSTSSVLSNGAGGPAASCSTSKTAASTSYSFADEVQAVGVCSGSADAISLSEIDEAQRSLTAGFRTAKHQIVLHVTLPSLYPNSCAPSFQFGKGTTIGSSGKSKVYKVRRRRRQDDFFYFLKEQILITKVVN